MGFRLYISKTPKGYDYGVEFRKFYGYCDYKYAKNSFEYLYSICGDEINGNSMFTFDDLEDTYDLFTCAQCTDRYKLTAEQFRIFISKYIAGMQWWYNDEGNIEKLTLHSFDYMNSVSLLSLYTDKCDKYINWR